LFIERWRKREGKGKSKRKKKGEDGREPNHYCGSRGLEDAATKGKKRTISHSPFPTDEGKKKKGEKKNGTGNKSCFRREKSGFSGEKKGKKRRKKRGSAECDPFR